ncbi:MAG: fibrobacter succinogenes major paralogous domain-containing protein [Tannerella sp.]|jgi:uncharacterized protein (TIGR02145 family)|nr:fibrobacter succinogenes major paralogous domain-containing protein [Tannerella sp.]
MKQKMIFLALTLFVLSAASANAQVRIGGTTDPHSAATLDLNASNDDAPAGNLRGFSLPRISLTSVDQKLNNTTPLNGVMIWNTNENFYLGKGVYVWGDDVWVPIQRTLIGNSILQPITSDPFITILSNPTLGPGVTFQVPAAYSDMSNTARFLWEVVANGSPTYTPNIALLVSTSGSRQEVLFVPYDNTVRTYSVRVKAISNNGTSDSQWSAWVESDPGQYQGWYRINGATGYDIFSDEDETNPLYGRNRSQMSTTGNTYTVETLGGAGMPSYQYQWSIPTDQTAGLVSLGDAGTNATVELIFSNSIFSKANLINAPNNADTIVLQCVVRDDLASYTLRKRITVGDRDECSPVAKLLDAEGNDYTVSKFGGVCWMTQNLRSTYTMQGNVRQAIPQDQNVSNDNNAIAYYYPGANQTTFENNSAYGLLYSWGAANIGTATTEAANVFPNRSSDRQGICPDGWVIPSDYDWNQLEKEIATHPELYSSQITPFTWEVMYENTSGWRPGEGNPAKPWWGRSMKSPTPATTTATNGLSKEDGTGFNALLIGHLTGGNATNQSTGTSFWSCSTSATTTAWYRFLAYSYSGMYRTTYPKYYLFSIRCKKL